MLVHNNYITLQQYKTNAENPKNAFKGQQKCRYSRVVTQLKPANQILEPKLYKKRLFTGNEQRPQYIVRNRPRVKGPRPQPFIRVGVQQLDRG